MHLISAGGLHGKGVGGHPDSVFKEKQGRNHGNAVSIVCSNSSSASKFFHTLTQYFEVHDVEEDASESAFIRYTGADEIVAGSPQNSAYMSCTGKCTSHWFVQSLCMLPRVPLMLRSHDLWILAAMIWLQAMDIALNWCIVDVRSWWKEKWSYGRDELSIRRVRVTSVGRVWWLRRQLNMIISKGNSN